MCSRRRQTSANPIGFSATNRRRRFRKASGGLSIGIGRHMSAQTEVLLGRARERFLVQDYYGAVYLLDMVVDSGRAFADVHHLLGVCLSLLGQPDRALTELDRALELNPRYVEALIHRGLVLNELGRTDEAAQAFNDAGSRLAPPTAGLPSPVAGQLANQHAELADSYAVAG